MRTHHCPHCGGKHKAHGSKKHLQCPHCGGSWFNSLVSAAKSVASHPMVSQALSHAAPMAMALAQKHAPGLLSHAQNAMSTARSLASHPMAQAAMSHPMGQAAMGAVRSRLGMGGMLALGTSTPGEQAYAQMRASGRHHRRGGKGGLPGGLGMAGQVLGAIPGAAEALGPFGALLGIEPPPPPPPHATFGAVRAGPQMNARPHGVGRGMGHHKVHHSCPHCGCGKHSAPHVSKHKCRSCGGSWFSSLVSGAKALASHPMVSQALSHAAPMAMALAQKHAPGLVSHAQNAMSTARSLASHPMAQAALSHPMAQAAMGAVRSRLGMGRRSRGPTAHSLAVGKVMRETGMGLAQASRHVKHHGLAHHY